MTPRAVRAVVGLVCVAGISGMIAGSIADNNAVAMTCGLVTAVAALCLIVATAVGKGAEPRRHDDGDSGSENSGNAGAELEARITRLVEQGADETAVRALAQAGVELGRKGSTRRGR
jgi:hypothetical protein